MKKKRVNEDKNQNYLLSLRRYIKDDSLINARDDSEEDGKGHSY